MDQLDPDVARRVLTDSDALFMWVGTDGTIEWVNRAVDLLGFAPDEIVGGNVVDFVHPDDLERAATAFAVQVDDEAAALRSTTVFRVRTADGTYLECDVGAWAVGSSGVAIEVRPTIDSRLLRSLLADLLSGVDPALALERLLDAVFDRDDFTRCAIELDGGGAGSRIVGSTVDPLLVGVGASDADPWAVARRTRSSVQAVDLTTVSAEVAAAARDAALGAVWVVPLLDAERPDAPPVGLITMWIAEGGPPLAVNGYLVDLLPSLASLVVRWRGAQLLLEDAALTDPLTRLPNRRSIIDQLDAAIGRATRHSVDLAVLFIDLDHFKPINDLLGHAAGDLVLVECARRLTEAIRSGDTAGRVGGDEFVVILDSPADDQDEIAQRIVARLDAPIDAGGQPVKVGASIGIASLRTGDDADTMLRRADDAMYRAKAEGRGRARREAEPSIDGDGTIAHDPAERLVAAAASLLGEVGPRSATVAELSRRAGVGVEAIRIHFGSRDELLRAGMRSILTAHLAHPEVGPGRASRPMSVATDPDYWRAIVHCMLDGEVELASLEVTEGLSVPRAVLTAHPELLGETLEDRAAVASSIALQLGWAVLGPLVSRFVGVTADDEGALTDAVASVATRIARPDHHP